VVALSAPTVEPERRCDRCGGTITPYRDTFVRLISVRAVEKFRVCASCAGELRAELESGGRR
jgi:uncharacterized protein with PIN domain